VKQFQEMCLLEKLETCIRRVESMEMAWRRLDALYKDHTAFIKDMMQKHLRDQGRRGQRLMD
jgi:hypothetical protein